MNSFVTNRALVSGLQISKSSVKCVNKMIFLSEAVDTRLPVTSLVRVASGPDREKSKHARNNK